MQIKMWQALKTLEVLKRIKNQYFPAKVAYKFNKLAIELDKTSAFYSEELIRLFLNIVKRMKMVRPR